ncbi:type II toxin-antitoxin system RelE family toxin [Streptomyces beijiangensis]|uniref:Type II toxin-antitoxin system RelE/ParE family toxin n=1 Tax=Streptomyces beijiangensis TaxID=163361 RepID=A0A939JJE2_9ACTN|nr:type II toxin-antitoxin system RelE/ParE family toxin [Streptomyces beijiangensis]MBO0514652.1 type II toxin-antitoxin system RelE/ParE family toxin [Streptomyces beijiangensis]
MSISVTIEPAALDQLAGYLKNDPAVTAQIVRAIDSLTTDPTPTGSRAWGTSHRRWHVGARRILYRISEAENAVHVEHIGHA